ncbi:hypothetical protein BRC2024_YMPIZCAT_CDS_0004 [Acinetobacter phage vB_AbaP_Margaret]|uniref:Uncharacterized protein n=11 Tax=Autoscriptoviridae TaxID=3424635 RepID=A0A7T8ETL9_9CAUD|nr:hypothetical protein AU158_gp29 [Acinetobacter phage phiAB1]YP_009599217.1 hypothetical protein FDH31_gp30 [Acinetobacter phage vB_AbaP_AS12]YP_009599269.1 hypothetical protein FDH32_gp33 [Acinetobacter phage vB_AbaP_AS11]AZU99230.1 hypothetical protein APK2_31 [Acinetobacter phage vB_AbaP_APK2]AZU99280.1 hypothetical protein APK22_31 [Acinetobacter phage vB_AbaP_APK2-2]AZU99330.1 hypothetical protein APK93_31 [Acinetobacter phage vB_AbaP_APK93]QQM15071.1 hypothetical protein CPT_Paty_037 
MSARDIPLFTQEQYDYLDKYCFAENTELLTPEELIYKAGQRSVMYKIQTLINQQGPTLVRKEIKR